MISVDVYSETQTFGYDALYRLTSATGGLANYNETYQYDASTGNLVNKNGLILNYPAPNGARPHAVSSAGNNTYGYDDNGNQTTRAIAGQTVALGYDAENRLVSATGNNLAAQFTYDGDGRRVKSVVNGETILFADGHYELKGNEVTKYYFAGTSRIAVRKYIVPQSSTLTYLAGDHLGSTSLAVDASTGDVIQTRYKPWGEVRYTTPSKTLPTRYTFTGQYSYVSDEATDLGAAGFGLMFYNARWYDHTTGRFAQADTIVPGGVQGLDRYAYVGNNPIVYTDPSGHAQYRSDYQNQIHDKKMSQYDPKPKPTGGQHGLCDEMLVDGSCITWDIDYILSYFDITVVGASAAELLIIANAVFIVGSWLTTYASSTFQELHGPITITIFNDEIGADGNCVTKVSTIECHQAPTLTTVLHEFGHVFDNHAKLAGSNGLGLKPSPDNKYGSWSRSTEGFIYQDERSLEHPPSMGYVLAGGTASYDPSIWQARAEQFADLYMNFFLLGSGDLNHGFPNSAEGADRVLEFADILFGITGATR
ncbi:MAG: hypothetical protein HFACDABA_00733 [Anaerolineales bacterium]|nr:hypothetical protein [Anaerolineales bacterium]